MNQINLWRPNLVTFFNIRMAYNTLIHSPTPDQVLWKECDRFVNPPWVWTVEPGSTSRDQRSQKWRYFISDIMTYSFLFCNFVNILFSRKESSMLCNNWDNWTSFEQLISLDSCRISTYFSKLFLFWFSL